MTASAQWLIFQIERQRFAVALEPVVRVVPAVELQAVPGAPPVVVGVFDLHGEVIPVLDRRGRSPDSLRLSDQFIVLRGDGRRLALLADAVEGVVVRPASELSTLQQPEGHGLEAFCGATRLDDGLVLIYDVERFLSADEAEACAQVLEAWA